MAAKPQTLATTSAFEVLGPVMVGPSSSHTAGALRCARVAASLAGALLFSLLARGGAATARGLAWPLPLLALVCLLNPLFSASGSTLLFKLGPRSVYLESLAYGATMGGLMVAVVLWSEGAAAVLTQDRLLALAPRRARALPLLLGMAFQLVPQLLL